MKKRNPSYTRTNLFRYLTKEEVKVLITTNDDPQKWKRAWITAHVNETQMIKHKEVKERGHNDV